MCAAQRLRRNPVAGVVVPEPSFLFETHLAVESGPGDAPCERILPRGGEGREESAGCRGLDEPPRTV